MKKDFIFYTCFLSVILFAIITFTSCEQYIAKEVGGTVTINLEPGQKLVEVTWKGDADLWYLTEPMDSDYVPKTKIFNESSMLGVCEGKVIFIETR